MYNEDPDDIYTDLIVTTDSNLIAVGRSQAFTPTNYYHYDILLVKINFNLDTIWTKYFTHPHPDTSLIPQSVIQTSDNGFLICGKQRYGGFQDWYGFLYKVDSNGNFQWYKSYNNPGPYRAIWDVKEMPNHHFICSGATISSITSDIDACYFFTDSLGNQLTSFIVPTIGDGAYDEMMASNDSGYVLLGIENNSSGSTQPYINLITKIDTTGSIIWNKNYGQYYNGSPLGLVGAYNGGYVYVGGTDNTTVGFHSYMHRLDENGDSLWYREFNFSGFDEFWDIKTTTDGGYIMCRQTAGCNNNGGTCFWLVKTDSLGLLTNLTPALSK